MGHLTSTIHSADWNYGILGELLKSIPIFSKHFFGFEIPKELILLSSNNFLHFVSTFQKQLEGSQLKCKLMLSIKIAWIWSNDKHS